MNKKIIHLISLALCLCLALSSCSNKEKQRVENSREKSQTEETTNKDEEKEKNKDKLEKKEEAKDKKEVTDESEDYKKAGLLYNKILDNIDSYEFSDMGEDAEITYTYDLVYTRSSDIPDLLVAQNTEYGLSYLKIFSPNDDFTKEISADEIITIGVASAGGFRGVISQNADFTSLLYTTFLSGTGEGKEEEITTYIKDDSLKINRDILWEGNISDKAKDEAHMIYFSDIDDREKIESLASNKNEDFRKVLSEIKKKEEADNNEDSAIKEEDIQSSSQEQVDSDQTVVSGVVRVFNHDEMIEYQDINPELLPDMGEIYVVLFADEAVDITLLTGAGDGYHTDTSDMISLPTDMDIYQDQHITISFGPDDGHWQSDFSLPINAARMRNVNVIE
ncbi:MAG: hypothetical protein E7C95_03190 [Anaerococcus prevotii]|uniref:hypothetical protein n=1 Tax=Anaerococcus prevotii TaxID=33034 RepID=UPI002901CC0E|nr:hypothetical protein [Anaerococcus prevotii]MDU2557962.1 hypothetical protein [Anaerococcus prevotii]